jgi:hypothetical protein
MTTIKTLAMISALTLTAVAPAFADIDHPYVAGASGPIYSEQVLAETGSDAAPSFNVNPRFGTAILSSPLFDDLSARNGSGN